MSSAVCQHCGCAEIDTDPAQGTATCTRCGLVLEENAIVNDVNFQETGGGYALIGQFVSSDGPQRSGMGGPQGFVTRESREITLNNGRRRIQEVASQLRMNQHCIDTAFNFFKMAVARGLTRGRKSTHVVAACLYLSARVNNTPHMLLDFSDVLQVNVFELGKVFNFLARTLYINPPPTDPCVYVMRFAQCLHFNEKEHEVCELALRLVRRMKRDWLAFGRRPTGICGASLLLASRYYNFHRTIGDIVKVVNVGEGVVRKRLEEFSMTPSGALTLDDFVSVDLESAQDPPSFLEARNNKLKQQQLDLESKAESLEMDLLGMEKEVEEAIEEAKAKSPRFRGAGSKLAVSPKSPKKVIIPMGDPEDSELNMSSEFIQDEILRSVSETPLPDPVSASTEPLGIQKRDMMTMAEKMEALRPTLESLGIKKKRLTEEEEGGEEREDGELDLTGIDDNEIDRYLLSEPEVKMKTRIWMRNNWKHLKDMEEKARIKREMEEEELRDPNRKPKRQPRKRRAPPIHAATAGDAIELVVQEKKLSSKIDYEVLRSLTTPTPTKELLSSTETKANLIAENLPEDPVGAGRSVGGKRLSAPATKSRVTANPPAQKRRRVFARPTIPVQNQRKLEGDACEKMDILKKDGESPQVVEVAIS